MLVLALSPPASAKEDIVTRNILIAIKFTFAKNHHDHHCYNHRHDHHDHHHTQRGSGLSRQDIKLTIVYINDILITITTTSAKNHHDHHCLNYHHNDHPNHHDHYTQRGTVY